MESEDSLSLNITRGGRVSGGMWNTRKYTFLALAHGIDIEVINYCRNTNHAKLIGN